MAKVLYKLSREFIGHTQDVRNLAVGADGNIVSVSRDKTAILWKFEDGNYIGNVVMTGHSNFVSSVCVIDPSEQYPNGVIVTGSNDNHIFIYNPGDSEPIHKIKGHENSVCALKSSHVDKNSFLSSSWDITAKLWNLSSLNKPQTSFIGHSLAVWCVSDMPNGLVITGSADKTVIVYLRDGQILHKLQGHTDCVRDITVIKDNEFLTCANDALIKHWNATTGDCLGNYYGHSNYIYSISAIRDGTLTVSSGEDKSLIVWCNGELNQTIKLPTQSIWSVKFLPNEDIVCGASDGLIRIFTVNPDRYADSETIQRFEESVANVQINASQELGGMKINELPDSNALTQPGRKDGEVKMIREGNSVKAYSWSQRELKWNLIGDVMGANSENSGKTLHNGVEYDYVFSVDIEDGVPPLKLPYNKSQDPWHAAQKFIDDNNLSQYYLEQVANFIIKNSTSAAPINNSPQFADPMTGDSRYIPSSTVQSSVNSNSATVESCKPLNSSVSYIPLMNYLKLEQASLNSIHEKLKEFNTKQAGVQSVSEEMLQSIMQLISNQNNDIIESNAISNLISLLKWPEAIVFPVLDIARLAVLHKKINDIICTNELLNLVQPHLRKDAVASNQMLTFRLLANMFSHEQGERLCLEHKDELLNYISDLPSVGNKNNQVAISTYILNLVVALNKTNDSAGKTHALRVICNLLSVLKEVEAVFRILVSLGTLLVTSNDNERAVLTNFVRQSENVFSILKKVSESEDSSTQKKLICVSKAIIDLIV